MKAAVKDRVSTTTAQRVKRKQANADERLMTQECQEPNGSHSTPDRSFSCRQESTSCIDPGSRPQHTFTHETHFFARLMAVMPAPGLGPAQLVVRLSICVRR
ncbi:hypothetical protein VFPPC_16100 [Pochonia chlamydosporia 170]|uniref:Uncharacterized protein n=1 Tax=Pochonia chlamydosporia 170 TaxID=1380566 RepID=A0A179FPE1_METCM|nr:hypothetical protein VFPPC_16100 [Pochonia chlamydosporia 170]OAQ67011.1 hypothetical protein VFPPC_16100 [Pochonia chlamydosporia 170]